MSTVSTSTTQELPGLLLSGCLRKEGKERNENRVCPEKWLAPYPVPICIKFLLPCSGPDSFSVLFHCFLRHKPTYAGMTYKTSVHHLPNQKRVNDHPPFWSSKIHKGMMYAKVAWKAHSMISSEVQKSCCSWTGTTLLARILEDAEVQERCSLSANGG